MNQVSSLPRCHLLGRVSQRAEYRARKTLWSWRSKWCIAKSLFRSFLGHIETRRAMFIHGNQGIDLGPLFLEMPDGSLLPDGRTAACGKEIETLEASFPWVGLVDQKIFLLGFEAGERFSARMDGVN